MVCSAKSPVSVDSTTLPKLETSITYRKFELKVCSAGEGDAALSLWLSHQKIANERALRPETTRNQRFGSVQSHIPEAGRDTKGAECTYSCCKTQMTKKQGGGKSARRKELLVWNAANLGKYDISHTQI